MHVQEQFDPTQITQTQKVLTRKEHKYKTQKLVRKKERRKSLNQFLTCMHVQDDNKIQRKKIKIRENE